eukprot:350371-Chlamydomonas_euryale.AAC.1
MGPLPVTLAPRVWTPRVWPIPLCLAALDTGIPLVGPLPVSQTLIEDCTALSFGAPGRSWHTRGSTHRTLYMLRYCLICLKEIQLRDHSTGMRSVTSAPPATTHDVLTQAAA